MRRFVAATDGTVVEDDELVVAVELSHDELALCGAFVREFLAAANSDFEAMIAMAVRSASIASDDLGVAGLQELFDKFRVAHDAICPHASPTLTAQPPGGALVS